MASWSLIFTLLFVCFAISDASETDVLLKFKDSLANDAALSNWNASTNPCSDNKVRWIGVLCTKDRTVMGLQLENMSLTGLVDVDTLMALPDLRTLSFSNNSFDGPMPNLKQLSSLRSFFLSYNRFSGEIPDDAFLGMGSLKKIYLQQNSFSGKIPTSLTKVLKLLELRLDSNQLEGKIPNFQQKGLQLVNVSNNSLRGSVPKSLSKMDLSFFSGNKALCGEPLLACKTKKPTMLVIIIAIVAIFVILAAIVSAIVVVLLRLRKKHQPSKMRRTPCSTNPKKVASYDATKQNYNWGSAETSPCSKGQNGKLVFVRDDREKFELQDLLRASAEVLGSGTFGSSYKAALFSGPVMVVKRFKLMNNVGKEDFQEHMRRLGRLQHPNLSSLVAFYYRKDEKLLVSEFVQNGSLASQLHGKRTPEMPGLDWPTRLRIIKGVAKGLIYLYNELPSLTVPHGHLKSSNVLLNESFDPLLADYGLIPIVNKDQAEQYMVAYKSPEYEQYNRTTKKTDVWSFGILILEVLTGKFPENYLKQGKSGTKSNLASWVNSVIREEWTGEVFDKDMKDTKHGEGEMLKMLKAGLQCCEEDIEKRWDIDEAVERILELRERDDDEDYYSSYASEGDIYSSRAMTEDGFSFSVHT
ncbi:hypothetical protein GIB67_043218 [Kingdonia uniflora]|uniref:non-specific serine/threonine protein kinase n=1 Tax=Kingdonia uniflora TaxID=39325 RepID=A0A7J7NJK7_9MAGN|nr:hypothetical protein GIB67_043218 [Kingdonia uniflora]